MKKPEISVIMPVFNQENFVEKAVKSVLVQTFKDFEFLILDDGSTDNTFNLIKKFKDKRIKLFKNSENRGLSYCLNFLITHSKGKYIARMDADDICMPKRLEEEFNFLEKNPLVVLVGSWAKIINKKGKIISSFKHPAKYVDIRKKILIFNPFIHSSVMFKKDIVVKEGYYNETKECFLVEDYDLFLRIVAKYPCANIPKFLIKYRWLLNQKKQKKQNFNALKIRIKAIKNYGYSFSEVFKIIKPLFFYLIPSSLKSLWWRLILR